MTTPHETLKENLATAIADDTALVQYFVDTFGAAPLIIVNRYGAAGYPGENEAPFVWIFSEDAENDAGDVDEETFAVGVVVGACERNDSPRKFIKRLRTGEAAGLEIYGNLDKIEVAREKILAIARSSSHGAIFRTATRTESNLLEYPLEWAKLRLEYLEPETLSD